MKNQFYTEQKHRETMNSVDMLEGLINRMCVTNDIDELRHLLTSSMCSLSELLSVKNSKSVFLRVISDFSIRVIYHANGWG